MRVQRSMPDYPAGHRGRHNIYRPGRRVIPGLRTARRSYSPIEENPRKNLMNTLIATAILVALSIAPSQKSGQQSTNAQSKPSFMTTNQKNSAAPKTEEQQFDFMCRLDALNAAERARHSELTRTLKSGVRRTIELPDGYALELPSEGASVISAAEWATLERRCCPFFRFALELENDGGPAWLRITGRAGVKEFLKIALELKSSN